MNDATVVRRKDGRYLELERLIGGFPQKVGKGALKEDRITLVFDCEIETLSIHVLHSWRSQGVVALVGPHFGPRARFQASQVGLRAVVTPHAQQLREGERVWFDDDDGWRSGGGLSGPLCCSDSSSQDMAAFLASVSEDPQLLSCVVDVVQFGWDPSVRRF